LEAEFVNLQYHTSLGDRILLKCVYFSLHAPWLIKEGGSYEGAENKLAVRQKCALVFADLKRSASVSIN